MALSDIKEKLNEATFFLNQMRSSQPQRSEFWYYLSAFLSAFKSVDYYMCTEQAVSANPEPSNAVPRTVPEKSKLNPRFQQWRSKLKSEIDEKDPMRLLFSKRIASVHNEPVQPLMHASVTFIEPALFRTAASAGPLRGADGSVKQEEATMPFEEEAHTEVIHQIEWRFRELPEDNVVNICTEGLIRLGEIVKDYEENFRTID